MNSLTKWIVSGLIGLVAGFSIGYYSISEKPLSQTREVSDIRVYKDRVIIEKYERNVIPIKTNNLRFVPQSDAYAQKP